MTVLNTISAMLEDITIQFFERRRSNDLAIQLKKSTDIAKRSHVLADIMFGKELKVTIKSKKV